jgi:hypothetical protein
MSGRHPIERVPLDKLKIRRKQPTARTAAWFRWLTCEDCSLGFFGGVNRTTCDNCKRKRVRLTNQRTYYRRKVRAA